MSSSLLELNKQMRDEEFVRLFVANQRRIHGFIRTLVPNATDADDVLQETSITGLAKFESFASWRAEESHDDVSDQFVTWICTIGRYEALKYCRRKGKAGLVFDESLCDQLADRHMSRLDDLELRHAALRLCLEKLSMRDRAILRGRYEFNLKGDELAGQLQLPVNTIYKALQRIRRSLTECVRRNLRMEDNF